MVTKTKIIEETQWEIRWTPGLIRMLRGKRSMADFGELIGVTANTVWRWEAGRVSPAQASAQSLSSLAAHERFLQNWTLAGSIRLVSDYETASWKLASNLKETLGRRAAEIHE